MVKQIPFAGSSNSFIAMEVAEDCVVFAASCLCHDIKTHAQVMINETKAVGMTKIVVVGDCDDHDLHHEEVLATVMQEAGIEHVWLPEQGCSIPRVMPGWSETAVKRFDAAADFGKLRQLLDDMSQKVHEIEGKIEYGDKRLLREYPLVAKIQSIESSNRIYEGDSKGWEAFHQLFFGTLPSRLVSEVNAVMLLNPEKKEGVLVTKSQEIKFTLTRRGLDVDNLQGRHDKRGYTKDGCESLKISLGPNVPDLSVYCEPGVWTIAPHPELKGLDPNVHYVPMWQRVVKA